MRGELEWAAYLRSMGIGARRAQQYRGTEDSADVLTDLDGWVHFEVKRTERLRLEAAMEQGSNDAKEGTIAVVAHRRNRGEWLCTLSAADLIGLLLTTFPEVASKPVGEGGSMPGERPARESGAGEGELA